MKREDAAADENPPPLAAQPSSAPPPAEQRLLPPLNLSHITGHSFSTPNGFQPKVAPVERPKSSSFSVPPSSRPVHTYSVQDSQENNNNRQTPSPPDDSLLHARTANYETLLRQFKLMKPTQLVHNNAPSTPSSTAATRTGRLFLRTSSAEDILRHSLTRLGSSLTMDRIRRRSTEGSAHATSGATAVDAAAAAVHTRFSLARSVRRLRIRVHRWLWMLTQPLSPHSPVRLWLILLLTVVGVLFYWPFVLSFLVPRPQMWTAMQRANIALELAWLGDVLLTFNTAVELPLGEGGGEEKPVVIVQRREIARAYWRRGRLAVDVAASLPLDTVAWLVRPHGGPPVVATHATLYYVGHTLRLLRLRSLPSVIHRVVHTVWTRSLVAAVAEVVGVAVVAVHWLACLWHAVYPDDANGGYTSAVVEVTLLLAGDGHRLVGGSSVPHDLLSVGIVVAGAVLSALATARLFVAVSHCALAYGDGDDDNHSHERRLAGLRSRLAKLELPVALQDRVVAYQRHLRSTYGTTDLVGGSSVLSVPLSLEVALCRYMDTLGRLPLWTRCSADLLSALLVHVQPRVYLKDDFLRRKGEVASELLVVQRGACAFMASHRQPQLATVDKPLGVGAAIGQLALLADYKAPQYVRAATHVEVAVVDRAVLERLLNRFVGDRARLIRRILRAALESKEDPRLWQLVSLYRSRHQLSVDPATDSSRLAAKVLVDMLAVPEHEPLRLPLALDQDAVVARPRLRRQSSAALATARSTASRKLAPADTNSTVHTDTSTPTLDDVIHTQATLVMLVQSLTDVTTRLDARLARIEERGQRDETARYAGQYKSSSVLLRRRSSRHSSQDSTGSVLLRRQSSRTTSDLDPEASSRSEYLPAARVLAPAELAALESSLLALSHTNSPTDATTTAEAVHSTFDEGVLELGGVHVLSSPRPSLSSPASSRTNSTSQLASVPRVAKRSRSLSSSTRRRLVGFQTSLAESVAAASGEGRRRSLTALTWLRQTNKPASTT